MKCITSGQKTTRSQGCLSAGIHWAGIEGFKAHFARLGIKDYSLLCTGAWQSPLQRRFRPQFLPWDAWMSRNGREGQWSRWFSFLCWCSQMWKPNKCLKHWYTDHCEATPLQYDDRQSSHVTNQSRLEHVIYPVPIHGTHYQIYQQGDLKN